MFTMKVESNNRQSGNILSIVGKENIMKDKNYVPFGTEWEKEMMKLTKKELVAFIKRVCRKSVEIEENKKR